MAVAVEVSLDVGIGDFHCCSLTLIPPRDVSPERCSSDRLFSLTSLPDLCLNLLFNVVFTTLSEADILWTYIDLIIVFVSMPMWKAIAFYKSCKCLSYMILCFPCNPTLN